MPALACLLVRDARKRAPSGGLAIAVCPRRNRGDHGRSGEMKRRKMFFFFVFCKGEQQANGDYVRADFVTGNRRVDRRC